MNEKQTILIADDDSEIREVIRILLENEGYLVLEAINGSDALSKMTPAVSLIILDVMMPVCSGIDACVELRKNYMTPVLFLTAKSSDTDKVVGFNAGGDDYLVKPFSYTELLSRAKALIRRHSTYNQSDRHAVDRFTMIYFQDIRIDTETKRVYKNEEEVILTEIEYQILLLLSSNRKKIFSVKNIYETVWQEPYFASSNNTVNVHIRNLRKKLEDNEQPNRYILNIWGRGYRID
ncbi:MAG: response regulator transcription factor [Lachnospiraceae bacterium]|jgi:DNA-binding response OmpR family regulator|nr:response regulator transcription factor [Lachnospiraceae bacterium]